MEQWIQHLFLLTLLYLFASLSPSFGLILNDWLIFFFHLNYSVLMCLPQLVYAITFVTYSMGSHFSILITAKEGERDPNQYPRPTRSMHVVHVNSESLSTMLNTIKTITSPPKPSLVYFFLNISQNPWTYMTIQRCNLVFRCNYHSDDCLVYLFQHYNYGLAHSFNNDSIKNFSHLINGWSHLAWLSKNSLQKWSGSFFSKCSQAFKSSTSFLHILKWTGFRDLLRLQKTFQYSNPF